MRLFAALYPSAAALDHLALALADAHAQEARRPDGAPLVRWTSPELWHLTVSFFGDVPEGAVPDLAAALEPVAREAAALGLRRRGAEQRPSPRARRPRGRATGRLPLGAPGSAHPGARVGRRAYAGRGGWLVWPAAAAAA